MNEFSLFERNKPAERQKLSRTLVAVLGIALVLVAGIALVAYLAWSQASEKYQEVSQSSATFQAGDTTSSYSNPPYGVKLTLPARWRQLRPVTEKHFCTLAGPDEFGASFWPIFPALLPTLEANVDGIIGSMSRDDTFALRTRERIEINGMDGWKLRFSTKVDNFDLVMVVVKRGIVVYVLTVMGPTSAEQFWGAIDDSLPGALEIT